MASRYGYDKDHPIMVVSTDAGVEVNDMTRVGPGGSWLVVPEDVWREMIVAEYRDIYWREKHPDLLWGEFNERFPLEAFPLP